MVTNANGVGHIIWLMICSALVLMMQGGFVCLESGMVRAKNSINVAIKNMVDFCLSSLLFWMIGFALMFGASYSGLFGTSHFFFNAKDEPLLIVQFVYQLTFCGTATTIISGAVSERLKFGGYILIVLMTASLIYPFFGHWAWGNEQTGSVKGWLNDLGFIDAAGSTVVHSVGGWVGLAAILVIGPRLGRFIKDRPIEGHNLSLSTLGFFLLWFGWLGFNGGSAENLGRDIPLILANTVLAGAAGGIAALALSIRMLGKPNVQRTLNGGLAGLVAITASCNIAEPREAVFIGLIGGAVCFFAMGWLEKMKIDDPVGAVATHAFGGVWGTLAVALVTDPATWKTGLSRWEQLGVQALGVGTCFIWAFGLSYLLILLINRIYPLRVHPDAEHIGLNISEHDAGSATQDILSDMRRHQMTGDFADPIKVEPHTEIGEIANQYNRVLARVESEAEKLRLMTGEYRDSEDKVRNILDTASDAFISTNSDHEITTFNQKAEEVFGYKASEIIGQSINTLLPSEHRNQHYEQMNRFSKEEKLQRFMNERMSVRGLRKNGEMFHAEITISYLKQKNEGIFTAIVRDITERLEVEEKLKAYSLELERSNRDLNEFAFIASHDLQEPLRKIIMFGDRILHLAKDPSDKEKESEYLERMLSAVERMRNFIDSLLEYSKITPGPRELQSIDLKNVVKEILKDLELSIKETNAKIIVNSLPRIEAEPLLMRQLFQNLITNAIKFRQEDTPPVITINSFQKDSKWEISVEDNGTGFDSKYKDTVFKPFKRLHSEKAKGTGIGLAICFKIVERHGGEIRAESEPGKGARFIFSLPEKAPPNYRDIS